MAATDRVEVLGQVPEVPDLGKRALCNADCFPPRFRQTYDAIPAAQENLEAKLRFQHLNLLAYARLGGVEYIRSCRDVITLPMDFADIA